MKQLNKENANNQLSKSLPDQNTIIGLAEIFKVIGDPTRLRICMLLSKDEYCVSDLAAILSLSESAVSHQLRLLKSLRLVKYHREGKLCFYALDDHHVAMLIKQGLEHVKEKGGI